MKFLIQKFPAGITHDFAFTLIESIRFNNWLHNEEHDKKMGYRLIKYTSDCFKPYHQKYIPIGSVEFVTAFLQHFYNLTPKPINIPEELFDICYTQRKIFNGTHLSLENHIGTFFVKSNDKIKYFTELVDCNENGMYGTTYSVSIPDGNYQISEYLGGIDSEWRAFVYDGKLVGLQNYSGDFTKFPNVSTIKSMIYAYKSAPVAYTLDVAVCAYTTVIIEVHDFFSCGLYGFADHKILPYMFRRWFSHYTKGISYNKIHKTKPYND